MGTRDGAVAQLGERRNGIAKVRGSIPLGSTIPFLIAGLTAEFASSAILYKRLKLWDKAPVHG